MTPRLWICLAGVSGALSVALGAYGAHGLDGDDILRGQFDTANRYHMWHTLALLGVGLLSIHGGRWTQAAGSLFILGMLMFCGTLYIATITGNWDFGFLAPWGGMALIAGWLALCGAGLRLKK